MIEKKDYSHRVALSPLTKSRIDEFLVHAFNEYQLVGSVSGDVRLCSNLCGQGIPASVVARVVAARRPQSKGENA